jgi:hypothetical protein
LLAKKGLVEGFEVEHVPLQKRQND